VNGTTLASGFFNVFDTQEPVARAVLPRSIWGPLALPVLFRTAERIPARAKPVAPNPTADVGVAIHIPSTLTRPEAKVTFGLRGGLGLLVT
jgi:hypothetical protein